MSFNDLYIDNLSGKDFEDYLSILFTLLGYKVKLTKSSRDYGADLIITKDNSVTAVQAKRYDAAVGISAIQEVIASKEYYKTSKCIVVTNNYFTPNAKELALCNHVELWDRDILIKVIVLSLGVNRISKDSINLKQNLKTDVKLSNKQNEIIQEDELLDDVIKYISNLQEISTAMLQRTFRITYNRATTIMDQLESTGAISPRDRLTHKRKVLVNKDNLKEYIKSSTANSGFFNKLFRRQKH